MPINELGREGPVQTMPTDLLVAQMSGVDLQSRVLGRQDFEKSDQLGSDDRLHGERVDANEVFTQLEQIITSPRR